MKLLSRIINFRISTAEVSLAHYLQPVRLNVKEVNTMPILKLRP
jgi:hypothetical protein